MKDITVRMQVSGTPVDHLSESLPTDWWAWIWTHIAPYMPPVWMWQIVGVLFSVVLAILSGRASLKGLCSLGRLTKAYLSSRSIEDVLTVVAASIATGVSATGMWRFAEDVLHLPFFLRVLLFAFIEVAIVTSAVRARRNMRENFSAGVDGMAVWALTVLTAVLSSMDARSLPEAVFRLAAPLVAAWLWERGMAIERHRIRGTGRINWRLTPERVLVRFGLAEAKDRTASEVDIHRKLTRVALAGKRVHQLRQANARPRKLASALALRDRRLDEAVEHTDLATNPATRVRLLDIATTLGGGDSITEILATAPAPWQDLDHPAVTGRVRRSEAVELAAALDRNTATRLRALGGDPVATGDRSVTTDATGRGDESISATIPADGPSIVEGGRSWLASLTPWSRPQPRPVTEPAPDRSQVAEPVAEVVAGEALEREVVATDTRPVADRKRPDDQDRRRAIRFWVGRAKKLNPPSKRDLADWSGFSETWALGCIQEARQQMAEQGWTFDDRGAPIPPSTVADSVAIIPAEQSSPNGSGPRPEPASN
jgi:hypothetical protein